MSASDSVSTLVEGILHAVDSFIPIHRPTNYSFDVRALYTKAVWIISVPSIKQECIYGWFAVSLLPDSNTIVSIYVDEEHQGHMYTKHIGRYGIDSHVRMSRENLEQLPEELLGKIHETMKKEPKFDYSS